MTAETGLNTGQRPFLSSKQVLKNGRASKDQSDIKVSYTIIKCNTVTAIFNIYMSLNMHSLLLINWPTFPRLPYTIMSLKGIHIRLFVTILSALTAIFPRGPGFDGTKISTLRHFGTDICNITVISFCAHANNAKILLLTWHIAQFTEFPKYHITV